ncbi:hypothetical protein [Arthrobacter sp. Soil782]|uniref:hypothetical protein n=1 Tax=Arthrobacter sp. Soil782 TaxID=1736410 RepID=UPI0012FCAB91|nr:hypothetical protein [Arthrobacter sp. Soil782]
MDGESQSTTNPPASGCPGLRLVRAVVVLDPPHEGREHIANQRKHAADQECWLRAGSLGRFAGRSPGFGDPFNRLPFE